MSANARTGRIIRLTHMEGAISLPLLPALCFTCATCTRGKRSETLSRGRSQEGAAEEIRVEVRTREMGAMVSQDI
jgi:hypothetical protein